MTELHPGRAFIVGAIDKEIRLSFAQRIKQTLPEPYQVLIGPEKEHEFPDFKFSSDGSSPFLVQNDSADSHTDVPFSQEGNEIAVLLKKKAPDEDFQPIIDKIHSESVEQSLDPLVTSTDVFMTAVCWVGSKSLSHVLACIDRTKGRLLDVGAVSETARAQIITAVTNYWESNPGVALSIVEKLLNYSILTPISVVQWALSGPGSKSGYSLAQPHIFEMVYNTVAKVTGRFRQVIGGSVDDNVKAGETEAMRELFKTLDDALVSWGGRVQGRAHGGRRRVQ